MPTSETVRAVNLQIPRVVKCPTPQCPGWITLDSTRHQTEPCRYCRIGVDTLRFLLSRVGAASGPVSSRQKAESSPNALPSADRPPRLRLMPSRSPLPP